MYRNKNSHYLSLRYIKGKDSRTKGTGNICPKWRNGAINAPFCLNLKTYVYYLLSKYEILLQKGKIQIDFKEFLYFYGCVGLKNGENIGL